MLIEILAILAGIIIGTITGLIPGLHINLILPFLASFAFSLNPVTIIIFIVALTLTYSFISFIPSIFLGCPDEDTFLSVLPGHEMLNKGKGYEAILLALCGGLFGIAIILILTPVLIFILPKVFSYLKVVMFFILLLTSGYLIFRDKNKSLGLLIFMLSGFLGLATLSLNLKQALLPLLTGLFGSSSLITSIIKKQKLPKQNLNAEISKKDIFLPSLASFIAAPLCSIMPALGSGQAAIIGSDITEERDRRKFLILLGSINVIVAGLSFITLYAINKARTGSAAIIQNLVDLTPKHIFIILAAILITGALAFFITKSLAKVYAKNINKINYRLLSSAVLIFLVMIVIIFSGFLGFLVFIIATATGLTAILLGARRTHLMGSLMLPSILLYLPF